MRLNRHLVFTAHSDGTRIHLDGDEVVAVYAGDIPQPPNFGYAGLVKAAEQEPPTVILGKRFRFEVAEPIDVVVAAVWSP